MTVQILHGDCRDVLRTLADESVHCCITSPPYWGLRSYLPDGHPAKALEIGSEPTVHDWVATMVDVFREVRRVLRPDGTLWLNLGDSYATGTRGGRKPTQAGKHGYWENPVISHRIDGRESGLKPKDLIGQPWRVAFALQADGWYLRQELIWGKRNPMPESVTDRFTKAHEQVFLLSKSERYYFDLASVKEPASEGTHARYAQNGGKAHAGSSWGFGDEPRTATELSAHKQSSGYVKGAARDEGVGRIGGHSGNPAEGERRNGKARARVGNKSMPTDERNGIRPRNNGVGFGHGYDAVPKPRVKNNESFDEAMAVMPATRNPRSVRWLASEPFKGAHYATYPAELIRPFVLAGCPPGGTVLDPFGGSGTTGLVADQHGRSAILIDLDERNLPMAQARIAADAPLFSTTTVSPIAAVSAQGSGGVCAAPNLPEVA